LASKTDKNLGGAATLYRPYGITLPIQRWDWWSAVGGDFPEQYLTMMHDRGMNIEGIEIKLQMERPFLEW
jgi:hypothetical protein